MTLPELRDFDLNVERVLESWTPAHAVREFVANALDEQVLTRTEPPTITKPGPRVWEVRDFGRGLRYDHLTQNENPEKHEHADLVIGRFGVGLKDALAVLYRRGMAVEIASRHGVITLAQHAKAGFTDVVTLHARVAPSRDPLMRGTAIRIDDIPDREMETAKGYFLAFSAERVLEGTSYGDILQRGSGPVARIYVNGMVVAEEENFAFSYNVTSMTEPMRRALNRERTHVGRSAYRERVKDMLLAARSEAVAAILVRDLEHLATGDNRDETKWVDVQLHACRLLSALRPVVFVTAAEHLEQRRFIDYAQSDGHIIVTIPETVARQLGSMQDVNGAPVQSLTKYAEGWHQRFEYQFIEETAMTPAERAVFALRHRLLSAAGSGPGKVRVVRVSGTIQPSLEHGDSARGVWLGESKTIVLHRDTLRSAEQFASVLLHEAAHAISGATDVTMEFEGALTVLLGRVSISLMEGRTADERVADACMAATASREEREGGGASNGGQPSSARGTAPHEAEASSLPVDQPKGEELARNLDDLRRLHPWSRFIECPDGGVAPRQAVRSFGENELRRHVHPPWIWDQRLRDLGAEPGAVSQEAVYRGERAVRVLLGQLPALGQAGALASPGDSRCDNADGSVVIPSCKGAEPSYRVRVTRLGSQSTNGTTRCLCRACADHLEKWALERFLRVERARLPASDSHQTT